MSKSAKSTSLVGMFFHSVSKESGYIEWQGVVIGNPEPGWYLLQLFSWIMGEDSSCRLVCIEDMATWLFYPDSEAMKFSYEYGPAGHLIWQPEARARLHPESGKSQKEN